MVDFSFIILAHTTNEEIFSTNKTCISSFIQSTESTNEEVNYEIIIVESNQNEKWCYPFKNLIQVTPETKFNFQKFLNIGLLQAKGKTLIFSNNDVIYDKYWLKNLLYVRRKNPKILSFSPFDPNSNKLPQNEKAKEIVLGYEIQKHITGWCLVIDRKVFNKLGKFDEQFDFYYGDNDYAMSLRKFNISHAVLINSLAFHIGGVNTEAAMHTSKRDI